MLIDIHNYKREKEFPFLTDWQRRDAATVAEALQRKGSGLEAGPRYISMPVGSGKTTGALWGIIRFAKANPNKKVCFLTPYTSGVNEIARELQNRMGKAKVGYYHSGRSVDKVSQTNKPVFVGTHQFAAFNHDLLDDFDLVVVDEAIYGTQEARLKSADFYRVSEWAKEQSVLKGDFRAVFDFVDGISQAGGDGASFVPLDPTGIVENLRNIKGLDVGQYGQSISDANQVKQVKLFCEALLNGQAFAYCKSGKNVEFIAGSLNIPSMKNAVILTATGGMAYDISGTFKEIDFVKRNFNRPSYEKVTLVQLSGPDIKGPYSCWKQKKHREEVVEYLEWVLGKIPENEIYLSLPLKVLEGCLRQFFSLPLQGDLELPTTVLKGGKTIHLSHHGVGVGSNDYKDCEAVVYLWDNHLPKSVPVKRQHALSAKCCTKASLADANEEYLSGDFKKMRDAFLVENVVQQLGRGAMRKIDAQGKATKMKAYVLLKPKTFEGVARSLLWCRTENLEGFGELRNPSSRIGKVMRFLRENPGQNWSAQDVQRATSTRVSTIQSKLDLESEQLSDLGYKFVKGKKGRGSQTQFVWVGLPEVAELKMHDAA